MRKGEVIFRQGDAGDTMYLIRDGAVEISRDAGGGKIVIALLERGDFFGEMVLLDSAPRSETATVISPASLMSFTRHSLHERLKGDPSVALHILRALCRRIEIAEQGGDPGSAAPLPVENPTQPMPRDGKRTVNAGETIFHQGDAGDGMYIILKGGVDIFKERSGKRQLLASLGRQDFFGEMSLLSDHPRTATVVATAPTEMLFVAKENFLASVSAKPEQGIYLLQVLTKRLRRRLPGESALDS